MTDITILFSTYNGEAVLNRTLEGYLKQKILDFNWEIIIVDNASSDNTSQILEMYKSKLPLKVIDYSVPGKNKALNSAIKHINSDFVVISDDDAIPGPNFLKNWLEIKNTKTEFSLFGGTIYPLFPIDNPPPDWMIVHKFHWEEIHAVRNLQSGPIAAREIFGPNMAVRKSIFDNGTLFNEDIGPDGSNKNYPMGSETEFCKRIEKLGYKAYFNSDSEVFHIIRDHQILPEFWYSRAYKHGLGFGLQEKIDGKHSSIKNKLLKKIKSIFKIYKHKINSILVTSNELKKNQAKWQYNWEKGYLDGLIQ